MNPYVDHQAEGCYVDADGVSAHASKSSSLAVVIRTRGYTREVSTPLARSIWIRGIKVPDQDDEQYDRQWNSGQSETPRNESVSFAWGDDRVKDHANQEAHQETAQVCKVVDVWDKSDGDANDQIDS